MMSENILGEYIQNRIYDLWQMTGFAKETEAYNLEMLPAVVSDLLGYQAGAVRS